MPKLKNYIINVTPYCCSQCIERIYPTTSYYPMRLGSSRALTLLRTCVHKLGVEVASWQHHPNVNLLEDEYFLLLACSTYKVIRKKYDDLLDKHDNVSSSHFQQEGRANTCMHYFMLRVFTAK